MDLFYSDEFKVISSTESYPDFIEITVKEIKETFNWARHQLLISYLASQQFTVELDSLENELINLINYSNCYNFADTPVNGFSAFVDLVLQLFRHLHQTNYFTTTKSADDLEIVVNLFLHDVELLSQFHDKQLKASKGNDKALRLIASSNEIVEKFLQLHRINSKQVETMVSNFYGFWNNQVSKKYNDLFTFIFASLYSRFSQVFNVFNDKKLRRLVCYQAQLTQFGLLLPQLVDSNLSRRIVLKLLNHDSQVIMKSFTFIRQNRWIVSDKGKNVFESKECSSVDSKLPLDFKLLQHKECENMSEVLIFYCHGGGFVATSSEFHEIYLKKFVGKLKDVPILCLDYSLRVPNPVVFQEFLDAYLWVTSESSEVIDKIGFHPKKIIISGDSAGGTIGMALVDCLTMIENKDPSITIRYPSDLIFFYGAFIFSAFTLPSRIKLFYDEVINIGTLCNITGCLSNIQGTVIPNSKSTNSLVQVIKSIWDDLNLLISICGIKIEDPWFVKDGQFDIDRIMTAQNSFDDTFFNSLKDFNYDKCKKIRLTLLTTNRCCFLDDNVELAKTWKGSVEMHTIIGAVHGFLVFLEEKKAFQLATQLLRKVITS